MEPKVFTGGQCQVSIVEHSKSQVTGKELVTYQLRYPRFIHAEFMTHRVFSRNAGSTRAIPTKKIAQQVREEPAFFVYVGENQPGMQAKREVGPDLRDKFYAEWQELAGIVATYAERWADEYHIHKQSAGRVLEPFMYMNVVMTATELGNWYELRKHEDAQPEIHDLAATMLLAQEASTPRLVNDREMHDARGWHLPYVTMEERKQYQVKDLLAMSAARCARVSYLTHDRKTPDIEKDIALYKRLVEERPLHASPLEHQALVTPMNQSVRNYTGGWLQHRALLETAGSIEVFHRALNVLDGTTV